METNNEQEKWVAIIANSAEENGGVGHTYTEEFPTREDAQAWGEECLRRVPKFPRYILTVKKAGEEA